MCNGIFRSCDWMLAFQYVCANIHLHLQNWRAYKLFDTHLWAATENLGKLHKTKPRENDSVPILWPQFTPKHTCTHMVAVFIANTVWRAFQHMGTRWVSSWDVLYWKRIASDTDQKKIMIYFQTPVEKLPDTIVSCISWICCFFWHPALNHHCTHQKSKKDRGSSTGREKKWAVKLFITIVLANDFCIVTVMHSWE